MENQLLQLVLSLVSILVLGALARHYWPTSAPLDAERISRALKRSLYFEEIKALHMSKDCQSAIVILRGTDEPHILIECFGDRVVTRSIEKDFISSWAVRGEELSLNFNDFTHPQHDGIYATDSIKTLTVWLSKEQGA